MLADSELKTNLVHIVKQAGALALKMRDENLKITEKDCLDFLSEADLAVQDYIITHTAKLTNIPFIAEESAEKSIAETSTAADSFFILDPIDGTANYLCKTSARWGISLGLVSNNIPVLGIIYLPAIDTIMLASKGEGTYINGTRIHCDQHGNSLADGFSTVEIGPWLKEKPYYFDFLRVFSAKCRGITAYCSAVWGAYELLSGNSVSYLNMVDVKVWDAAASWVLIEEAGGVAHPLDGSINWNKELANTIYACNRNVLNEILPCLEQYYITQK